MTDEHTRLLGKIEGKLDMVIASQEQTNVRLEGIDGRVRGIEAKAAVNGALTGGLVSIGVALAIENGKRAIGL
ncbi:hypothetical protein SQ11_05670 [Nitrosospira sp. NpAV]|nr:hypothetical protein SQ11_05670 [Nitrosospira sp. NpAV]